MQYYLIIFDLCSFYSNLLINDLEDLPVSIINYSIMIVFHLTQKHLIIEFFKFIINIVKKNLIKLKFL
jgi:hypothetical protein